MILKTLMVTYGNQSHKYGLQKSLQKEISVGSHQSHAITFPSIYETIKVNWDGESCFVNGQLLESHIRLMLADGEAIHFYLMDAQELHMMDTAGKDYFSIGPYSYDDIVIENCKASLFLFRESIDGCFKLEVYEGDVYVNHSLTKGNCAVEAGDQLFFDGIGIIIHREMIEIMPSGRTVSSSFVAIPVKENDFGPDYPNYHRSPRIIYREPEDKRVIGTPAPKPTKPSEQLARTIVPPLVMILALGLISLLQPRGIYIIVMLAMTVTTVIFSVTSYIKSVKKYKADMIHREKTYLAYIQRKTKELHEAIEEQRHALTYHYPDVEEIREMVLTINARIYEKTRYHHDFLTFRAGLGTVDTSFEIEFREEEYSQEEDELIDAAKELRSFFNELENVPVITSLTNGPLGFIGQRELVREQLQLLVMQIALFHSYHDVQFINIFPEEEKEDWNWMRWLPHASLQELNVRGFVYHERSRDQVLHSMYQVLKERKQHLEEKGNRNEKIFFSPHYVILITEEKLIIDHIIMEFFNEDPSELGVSLVFVQDVMQSLPEHVRTVVDIRDSKSGNIILEKGELVNKRFTPDHFPVHFNKEDISRGLAPLHHLQSLKNSIPESVTFLEMYNVEKVENLQIASRWAQNETYKTMAVPLGLRGKDDIVQLNLHEKAHGPHGLVAGTTGSGKSEIIQSYILSLAVNFHPYEVAFLLIDYKGGGMANLFKELPHLLGTITNLDRTQAMRALASIKAELQKRQRLFGEHDVNHINQYQKLYKQGKVSEAMPHLFLISDEFAELKSEQPDFMKELVSTARIGRSLGIHLILATQKPSGVVDDQIWSNSKFKLALKVQNASDSNEVLKTPDAAEITLPGRAYLQVGNNEIYELFQSAWSGADYVPDKNEHEYVDTTIYAINELGQYDILSEDLSGLDKKEEVESVPTELDAVIQHIHDYAQTAQIEPLPRPWLPPLPEQIFLSNIHPVSFKEAWQQPKEHLQTTIGLLDQPELQEQNPLTLDLTEDGHIVTFASPQYGKSTFLQSLVMDLTRQHHPGHLHVYLLDFGTNGLLPLKGLPHVADTILLDELEKMGKWIRIITNVVKERKRKLSKYSAADIEMYEKISGETVPNILIVIDNYDSVREADFSDELERIITQIAREGASIGIHLAISAGRQTAMRMPLLSNIKLQMALYLIDESEARSIVGKTDITAEELPGRGLMKLEEPTLLQIALPAVGEDVIEQLENLKQEADEMRKEWKGELPKPIPIVPDVLFYHEFMKLPHSSTLLSEGKLPFGVDFEDVMPITFTNPTHIFVGSTDVFKTYEVFRLLFQTLKTQLDSSIIDELIYFEDKAGTLEDYKEDIDCYLSGTSEKESMVDNIYQVLKARKDIPKEEYQPIYLLMPDCVGYDEEWTDESIDKLTTLLEEGDRYKIFCVVGDAFDKLSRSFSQHASVIKKIKNVISLSKVNDQSVFTVNNIGYREGQLGDSEGYLIENEQAVKIKLPKA
ncbi:S-DNA-T family DNA segregation ATPase FtsK/SpoIIIE [Gracilibacillus halotolerans]|uniref:S-DNA-T family DNA segregation ATPase FtsK/SpoIIIE n=1 Tax=Gracilibacillus halotolerans TaxID=74386 RepID=A0A841RM64_9BACI|nr:type VII secretion protein EssC [Gracilibacillus halotolerans]MBB6512977.1 S-DNA-T family DNA segregation ATPase FtsK/SpoIIIE [Gracilibacillus halotolerans]